MDAVRKSNALKRYYHNAGNLHNAERNRELRYVRRFIHSQKQMIADAAHDLKNIELVYDASEYISADSKQLSSACATFEKFMHKFANIATECEMKIMENVADLKMHNWATTANTGRVLIRLDSPARNSHIMFLRHDIACKQAERDLAARDHQAIQILYDTFKTRIHTLNNRIK